VGPGKPSADSCRKIMSAPKGRTWTPRPCTSEISGKAIRNAPDLLRRMFGWEFHTSGSVLGRRSPAPATNGNSKEKKGLRNRGQQMTTGRLIPGRRRGRNRIRRPLMFLRVRCPRPKPRPQNAEPSRRYAPPDWSRPAAPGETSWVRSLPLIPKANLMRPLAGPGFSHVTEASPTPPSECTSQRIVNRPRNG